MPVVIFLFLMRPAVAMLARILLALRRRHGVSLPRALAPGSGLGRERGPVKGLVPTDQEPAGWESRSRSSLSSVPERRRANTAGQTSPSRTRPTCSSSRIPRSSASAFVGGSSRAQIIASRARMVRAMSGRFAAMSASRVSAVSAKPPRRRRTASSRTSGSGTVRPARRNGQRRTKATTNTSVSPAAAAQSLRAAGGIGWRRFRPGSRTLTTFAATRRRFLSNRDGSLTR